MSDEKIVDWEAKYHMEVDANNRLREVGCLHQSYDPNLSTLTRTGPYCGAPCALGERYCSQHMRRYRCKCFTGKSSEASDD